MYNGHCPKRGRMLLSSRKNSESASLLRGGLLWRSQEKILQSLHKGEVRRSSDEPCTPIQVRWEGVNLYMLTFGRTQEKEAETDEGSVGRIGSLCCNKGKRINE